MELAIIVEARRDETSMVLTRILDVVRPHILAVDNVIVDPNILDVTNVIVDSVDANSEDTRSELAITVDVMSPS